MSLVWRESKKFCRARGIQFGSTVVRAQEAPHGQSKLTIFSLSNGSRLDPWGHCRPPPGTARWANHSGPRSPEQSVQSHSRQIMTRLGGCEQLSLSLYFRAWHCSLGLGRVQKAWVFTGSCVQRPVGTRCKAGRAAARPLPPRACSTLPVGGGGGWNSSPNRSQALLGSNAGSEDQHSKIIFIARAGMLKPAFQFLFMSWGFCLFCFLQPRTIVNSLFGYLTGAIYMFITTYCKLYVPCLGYSQHIKK